MMLSCTFIAAMLVFFMRGIIFNVVEWQQGAIALV